ncbi:unnamed protein product, partial [Ilex paraguariensis]
MGHQPYQERVEVFCEFHPEIPRRQLAYEDNMSEVEEDAEAILQNNRRVTKGNRTDRHSYKDGPAQ